jgi:hypothetical protein
MISVHTIGATSVEGDSKLNQLRDDATSEMRSYNKSQNPQPRYRRTTFTKSNFHQSNQTGNTNVIKLEVNTDDDSLKRYEEDLE